MSAEQFLNNQILELREQRAALTATVEKQGRALELIKRDASDFYVKWEPTAGGHPLLGFACHIEALALHALSTQAQASGAKFKQAYCPCGGIILADTEDWKTPLCDECYTAIGEPENEPNQNT